MAETPEAMESQIKSAMLSRSSYFQKQYNFYFWGAIDIEKTLAMIKRDGVSGNYSDRIKEVILESGFSITQELRTQLDEDSVKEFYAEHSSKSFFTALVKYMTSVGIHWLELCEGGELFDRIVAHGHYSERAAATVAKTVAEVVRMCHANGVIRRDLKRENFLFANKKETSPLKAIDFGHSVFFRPG